MFLLFVLLLLVILFGILVGIYSVFLPFMQNIGTVSQYTSAYYGAIAGVERGELSLKYRSPGFEGSGGYVGMTGFGPVSDYVSGTMDMLTMGNNGFDWAISSRTKQIPSSGAGNVDYLLAAPDSNNYNMIDYFHGTRVFLSVDATSNSLLYYSGATTSLSFFSGGFFSGDLRLPPKVLSGFGGLAAGGKLCFADLPECDPDGDGMVNDPVINWFIDGSQSGLPFTIVPTVGIYDYSGKVIDEAEDIAFRKNLFQPNLPLFFGNATKPYSPLVNNGYDLSGHTVISSQPSLLEQLSYATILQDSNITDLQLSLGLVNLLRSVNDSVYPFLEYRLFFPQAIADTHYLIKGHSRVGEYDVVIYLKKPTYEGSAFGDFTVVF